MWFLFCFALIVVWWVRISTVKLKSALEAPGEPSGLGMLSQLEARSLDIQQSPNKAGAGSDRRQRAGRQKRRFPKGPKYQNIKYLRGVSVLGIVILVWGTCCIYFIYLDTCTQRVLFLGHSFKVRAELQEFQTCCLARHSTTRASQDLLHCVLGERLDSMPPSWPHAL